MIYNFFHTQPYALLWKVQNLECNLSTFSSSSSYLFHTCYNYSIFLTYYWQLDILMTIQGLQLAIQVTDFAFMLGTTWTIASSWHHKFVRLCSSSTILPTQKTIHKSKHWCTTQSGPNIWLLYNCVDKLWW